MSFSHSADFNQIFLLIKYIMISQEEGQGRTTPMLRNSWDKGAFFLRGGLPYGESARKIFLDNSGNPGKIVNERGRRRPSAVLIIPRSRGLSC
jgi:hypothetical protein